jgi:hypothetical protein
VAYNKSPNEMKIVVFSKISFALSHSDQTRSILKKKPLLYNILNSINIYNFFERKAIHSP